MDEPISKRLIISGLTPAISVEDLSRRLTTFGTVKAADGFGLPDGLGNPRNFGYVTLDTTVGKLAKCMNLLSGSTWKGAKLRFGEAKPGFKERIALENKKAAEEPPKKKRKRFGGIEAEDMTLVLPENAAQRPGWKVSALGRVTKPVKMRPAHPLPDIVDDKPKTKPGVVKFSDVIKATGEKEKKKKKKRVKDPDTRARRKVIDMTKYGSTHLKGMFLDVDVPMPAKRPEHYVDKNYEDEIEDSYDSDVSEITPTQIKIKRKAPSPKNSVVEPIAGPSHVPSKTTSPTLQQPASISASEVIPTPTHNLSTPPTPLPVPTPAVLKPTESLAPPQKAPVILPNPAPSTVPDNNIDILREKTQSLNLLNSLFGNDDDDWVGQEELDSDIDVSELVKGDRMLQNEDVEFEVVPQNAPMKIVPSAPADEDDSEEEDETEEAEEMDIDKPSQPEPAQEAVKDSKPRSLKDLFAPREEEAGFSLFGHLDLDLELDEDPLTGDVTAEQPSQAYESTAAPLPTAITLQTHPSQAPLVLDPKQALFFPLPKVSGGITRARQRDVYDLAKDGGWNWRDPKVGFYQTGMEEDIRKRWEESKGELTRDWKRRCREAAKVSRRKRGGVEAGDDL